MKKAFRLFLTMLLLVMGASTSSAAFKNFSAQFNNQDGTLLTSDEYAAQGTAVSFGVAVADDGTVSRVAADDETAVAVISGTYHSDHGLTNMSVVVPVDGAVKISVGQCTYSSSDIKVTNSANETVVTKTPAAVCWKNDHANVTELYYTGDATTLTISGTAYCPYIAVETTDYVPDEYTITYSLGSETAEGTLPASVTWVTGDTYTVPANRTLYKDGYTLTGWSIDGVTYKAGETYTPTADVTAEAVFEANAVALSDRTEEVTLLYDFQTGNGAPTMAYQNATGIYVTQAEVNGSTIDVKLDFDTNNGGKIANANWSDWCQMNGGTTLTIPSAKGAVVSIYSYSTTTTTTIDGQTDYTTVNDNLVTATIASKEDSIDIVIGDGRYFRYIQTVLPVVVASSAGTVYSNQAATVTFPMASEATMTDSTVEPADGFSVATFDIGSVTLQGSTGSITDENGTATGVSGLRFKPTDNGNTLTWMVRPATGLIFTPTVLSGYVNRNGTDAENCLTVSAQTASGEEVALGTWTALRSGKTSSNKPYDATAIYKFEITLTEAQQALLTGTESETFYLYATLGVNTNKDMTFANITIEGTLDGTIADVEKYTIATATNLDGAGTVSLYPNTDEYEAGDEITVTAAEAFGYDFVSWTTADGSVVSEDAKFTYTVSGNETLTANFVKVNTYELAITVEGGANDYMVTLSPEATDVDGKAMYEEGTRVSITASSNDILTFASWSNGETASQLYVDMTEDMALTASYAALDYIVGWDFYQSGSSARAADFAAADNDAVSLILRDDDGNQSGWLDKSELAAGGYEGRPAAVNWRTGSSNGDVGHYYWQTSINASAFTDIQIITAMLYNYNAYQKQNVDYSLDGETWTTVGTIVIPSTKNWVDSTFTLPAECNNQEKIYIRWISDRTSTIDGTSSANDGIALGATYIIGTAKLVDDGTAPALVSSVPANDATNASTSGKIVLTFDEKVQLTDNASATLNGNAITGTVSGKTVIFEYKGLTYTTDYTFVLAAGSVADLTDNAYADAITINFTTKQKSPVTKKYYDYVVTVDGTIDEAFAAANAKGSSNTERYRVLIPAGDYTLTGSGETKTVTVTLSDGSSVQKSYPNPTTYLTASNISFIGVDYETTVITNAVTQETYTGSYGEANIAEGIGNGDVLSNSGTQNYFQGLTMKSSMGDARGRDIVLNDKGNKTIFKDACLWAYQDTYVSNNSSGKFYFEGGVLRGRTDYLCGKGDVYYNEVTLQQCGTGGYLAVPSTAKNYGYVFYNCYIKQETSNVTFYLGRPWGSGTPLARFINTKMDVNALGNGWADMSGGWPKQFAEYNSYLTSGTTIDLSERRTSWTSSDGTVHENVPILTLQDVAELSLVNVMGQDDDWDPTELTDQASAPANVVITSDNNSMTWDDNDYVLCWVVFKDGAYVAQTIEPSYTVDDANATWTVRAANEAGGLGEATTATVSTAVQEVVAETDDAQGDAYNVAGQRVSNAYKGIIVKKGKKYSNK